MEQELIDAIGSLEGENLGSILKQFSLLVNQKQNAFSTNISKVLSSLNSEDCLQKLFRLGLVDKFRQEEVLLQILKSGDKFSLKRVLKCKWFFEKSPDVSVLINNFFPEVSFYTKLQMVKSYSRNLKDQQTVGKLYNALQEKYDSKMALILLPSCSQQFVTDKLFTLKTKVPPSVFLKLLANFPNLGKEYLEFLFKSASENKRIFRSFDFSDYDVVLLKLASIDPQRFIAVYKTYSGKIPYMKLGRKTCKKIIVADTDGFIRDINIFSRIVPIKTAKMFLKVEQLEKLQLSLYPKSITQFFSMRKNAHFLEVVDKLKRIKREEILIKNFKNAFSREFIYDDFTTALKVENVQHFPLEVRVKWIQENLPSIEKVHDKAEALVYLPTSISIPMLKKLVCNEPDLHCRVHLWKCIVDNLDYNNDLDSFPELLKFFIERFRNDQAPLREQILDSIASNNRFILSMKLEDCEIIYELFKIIKLNKEQSQFEYMIVKISKSILLNYFKKGISLEPHVKNYVEQNVSMFKNCDFSVPKIPPFQKLCLTSFLNEFQSLKYPDVEKERSELISLFSEVSDYNLKNKKCKIDVPDWMVERLKTILKDENKNNYWDKPRVIEKILKHVDLQEKIIPDVFLNFVTKETISYVLKRTPEKITCNMKLIMEKLLNDKVLDSEDFTFIGRFKMYSSYGIPQKMTQICLEKIENIEDNSTTRNAVKMLMILMDNDKFLKIVEKHYPDSLKIEYDDSNEYVYTIQQEIASNLKLFNNPKLALVPIKKFAGGDYLKYVVGSINSVSLQIPEVEILPVLEEMMDSRVSVKKHFIRSFFKVALKTRKCKLVTELYKTEKNSSMRLLLFEYALQMFCSEPCPETFEAFKSVASSLDSSDTNAIKSMFNLEKISDEYVSVYIQMLWELVSQKNSSIQSSDKNKIIELIDKEVLQLLQENFCETLLKQVFSLENLENIHLLSFISFYILYSVDKDVQDARLDKAMLQLKNLVSTQWNNCKLSGYFVFPVRKFLSQFVKTFCENTHDRDKLFIDPSSSLKEIKTQLKNMLPDENIFEDLLLLDFTIMYHEDVSSGVKNTPSLYKRFIKSSFEKFSKVSDALKLDLIQKTSPLNLAPIEKLELCESLLSESCELCNMMGVRLTPRQINQNETVDRYKNVIRLINENPSPNVKIESNSLFSKLVSTVVI